MEALLKSLGMIVVSEVGDKTFFIAAVLAMRNSRVTTFLGCWGALACMTALSATMGYMAPAILSKQYTHHAATALFLFFGARSLVDAVRAGSGVAGKPSEELREVEEELTPELGANGKASPAKDDGRKAARIGYPGRGALLAVFSPLFLEAFAVTFLAEWGDKSQISTVAMAAQDGVTGVTIGGTLGHALCTGAAVIGGRELGTKVSARAVEFTAGVLFLLFGIHALLEGAG